MFEETRFAVLHFVVLGFALGRFAQAEFSAT